MALILGCLALGFPRLVIILIVIFSDYIGTAYQTTIWPLLGFFFMPLTTLAYAWAIHEGGGSVSGFYLAVVIIAALIDFGLLGGASQSTSRARRRIKR